jgi:hypothetical protein
MSITIANGSLAHMALMLPVRALLNALTALLAILAGLCSLWRPIALAAVTAGAFVLCVSCPALPVGLALVAAFAYATYPRTAVR